MASEPSRSRLRGSGRGPAFLFDFDSEAKRNEAEIRGYTVVDPPSVVATHLTEISNARRTAIEQARPAFSTVCEEQPALVDDLVPQQLSLGGASGSRLLEGVPIRNLVLI